MKPFETLTVALEIEFSMSPQKKIRNPYLAEEDYYFNDQGLMVFTEKYHLKRGYCCKSGCKHCPYGFRKKI